MLRNQQTRSSETLVTNPRETCVFNLMYSDASFKICLCNTSFVAYISSVEVEEHEKTNGMSTPTFIILDATLRLEHEKSKREQK